MDTSKSEFFHFGILPQVCIHSPIEDDYSHMYKPRKICDCGSNQWINSTMNLLKSNDGNGFFLKQVHRCEKCDEVRMADHIGIKNE